MYGIAFLEFHDNGYTVTGWVQDSEGKDRVWDDFGDALESNDIEYGWIGYVRMYPSGEKPHSDCKW